MDINSINEKIEYKTERIKTLQQEIKNLEIKKTQLENEKILKAVNEINIPISELKDLLIQTKERKM